MLSSSSTISSNNSTMNNNDRKRPISSSIRPSPPPPSAKRHGLSSSSNSRHSTKKNFRRTDRNEILLKKTTDQNQRQSRSKHQYRHIDNKSPSSSLSDSYHSINQEFNNTHKSTNDINSSNEIVATKKAPFNSMNNSKQKSDLPTETIYTKKATSVALIVKPSTKMDHRNLSEDELERKKQISNKVLTKSTAVIVPSSVMTVVKTPDLSKQSMCTDNLIIQQFDGNINPNPSTKLVKLVVPKSTSSSSSIKMLSNGDGLASALRIPTKIQLTKTLFVSTAKTPKTSSLISSTSSHQERLILSPLLSTNLLDIPIDMTENQQSIIDYHSSTTLPPTPPPPVIDNTHLNLRNVLSHTSNNQQEEQQNIKQISTMDIKVIEGMDSSTTDEHSDHQIISKRHSLTLSDWSVPPTSELSPTSLTSSSPDLTQNHFPSDDLLVELDSTLNFKQSTKRRYRSLSPSCPIFSKSYLQANETLLKPIKSKSLTRLSNSSEMKFMLINHNRSSTTSPIIKLSSSQRIRKRRRDNENFILNQQNDKTYKSKSKHFKIESDNQFIIKDLLNEIIEEIISINNDNDKGLKTSRVTSISQLKPIMPMDVPSNRKTKTQNHPRTTSVSKKRYSSSQSLDSSLQNESRSMIMTSRDLDELAYLLHANVHRGDYEQIGNPAKVEERMREMWSQMSNQKKNSYYKRVIQIYKRPNRDVVIASSSSTIDNKSLSPNDFTDNKNPSSISMNSLSLELTRQTSTPLSFHSIPSSTTDEQSIISPQQSTLKTNISTDIVNELIKGAKGLDKLSYSPTDFVNSIHNFVRLTIDKQIQTVKILEQQIEKKCSTQLNRATIFLTQKIHYFADKYQINPSNESMNELTLIVKYFYLLVLSLNCQKQEAEFRRALTDLLNGNLTLIDPSFCSLILTSIIEDLILGSSLANEYLASQPLIINNMEYSLPFIRHMELEDEILNKNDTDLSTNPFSDFNDLEDYLNRCEHMATNIPCYPIQQSHHPSIYYPTYHSSSQYYYPQSSDMNNYYYNPTITYPNSQQIFPYGQSTSYYHPSTTHNNNNNEQYKYYYNPQQQSSYTYASQTNSTNDIPVSNNPSFHRTYRQMSSNMQRTYSNSQQPATPPGAAPTTPGTPSTPAVFDATTVVSPQSKSMNATNNNYPP